MNSHLVRQGDFSGGEIAPIAYGRTDSPAYQHGLRLALNFIPTPDGQLLNRPGTRFIANVKNRLDSPRLIPFIFADGQTFVLEFGDKYIRFFQNSAQVLNVQFTALELPTIYAIADVGRLKYAQSGDVITIVHPKYTPQELTRITNTFWTLVSTDGNFGGYAPPAGFVVTSLTATKIALDNEPGYNSGIPYNAGDYVNDGKASYIALLGNIGVGPAGNSESAHNWALAIDSSRPMRSWSWVVTMVYRDGVGRTFESATSASYTTTPALYSDRPATLVWTRAADPGFVYTLLGYNIYRGRNGVYGFVGTVAATVTTYNDDGATPDYGNQPPRGTNPFQLIVSNNSNLAQSSPGAFTYHEQRAIYARSDKKPQDFWGSAIGKFKTFDINFPVQQSDTYNFRLGSERLEEIRSLLSLRQLLLFTGQGEWAASGFQGAITANSIQLKRSSRYGSGYLDPLAIEQSALFYTARGRVRDLVYDYRPDTYRGHDVSVIARHLFEGHQIVDWAFAETPYNVIWAVREDGVMLSLTYTADGIAAWAQHKTAGRYEKVCAVLETDAATGISEDAVYVVVARVQPANGLTVRQIERFSTRIVPLLKTTSPVDGQITSVQDVRVCNFLDQSVQIDGRNKNAATMQLSAPSGAYAAGTTATCTSVGYAFTTADPGQKSVIFDPDGAAVVARVLTYVSPTIVTVEFDGSLTAAQIAAWTAKTTAWSAATTLVTGLAHMVAAQAYALVDGAVAGPFTVSINGTITLPVPGGAIIQAGTAFTSDLDLLDVAADPVKTNVSSVRKVTFEVVSSRGLQVGETFDGKLYTPMAQKVSDGFAVPPLLTGNAEVAIASSWNQGGRACLRQTDPLPLTVVAVVREVVLGGR